MHLKSIVASGFKSFAEKTTINLSEYTNVIVGPNGSGKSNIVDAISWVLGNQSPGSLRTNKMEDVIFAGTEKLGEKGFAEVYLVFDLGDNNNFNSSEVSIGRKLYRDGTSEYFMNGLTCRLLDIQEFLNDVGIGKQQHIIISQGQITEILNAKPEDHRITIEEASGILPYKLKKDKALKRIESGEKEIKRAKDVEFYKGIGELPFLAQATFSVWKNLDSVMNFAYKSKDHSDIIKKTRKRNWYSEDMFTRFIIKKNIETSLN